MGWGIDMYIHIITLPTVQLTVHFYRSFSYNQGFHPLSFFADPDTAVFLNADLDPAAFLISSFKK